MLTAVPERAQTAPVAERAAPAARSTNAVLQLQRVAGNRAVGRMLARCGAGGCTCGGACGGGGHDDELLLEEGQRALRSAVSQR
jgi:hypothetical protein